MGGKWLQHAKRGPSSLPSHLYSTKRSRRSPSAHWALLGRLPHPSCTSHSPNRPKHRGKSLRPSPSRKWPACTLAPWPYTLDGSSSTPQPATSLLHSRAMGGSPLAPSPCSPPPSSPLPCSPSSCCCRASEPPRLPAAAAARKPCVNLRCGQGQGVG